MLNMQWNCICAFMFINGLWNCLCFQVDKAFEHLVQYSNVPERNICFSVTCGEHSRGICLRETYKILCPTEHLVSVEPVYLENNTGLLSILVVAVGKVPFSVIAYFLGCQKLAV